MEPIERQSGSALKPIMLGCGLVTIVTIVLMCGGLIWFVSGHEGGVRMSNQMETYATEYLQEHKILDASETLIASYDVTLSLSGEEAAILTDQRIIYHNHGTTTAIPLEDITDIRHRTESLIGDIIEIDSRSGIPMKIEIAPFNDGEAFLRALRDARERSGEGVPDDH